MQLCALLVKNVKTELFVIIEKIYQNVQLIDDDVYVTGAIPRKIDIKVNVNVDIDNAQYYSIDEREEIALRVEKAIRLFIDGGYRKDGRYFYGTHCT